MEILLDTNAVIAYQKDNERIWNRLGGFDGDAVCISSIVLYELCFGAFKSTLQTANLSNIDVLTFPVLDFDAKDSRAAAEIRADLQRSGTPIGPYDTLIAGQALARGLTLVTRNTREFARVTGLRVEDWEG